MKVSEILTKPSTTKESQNNTQSGISTLPDINFSTKRQITGPEDLPDDEPTEPSINIPEELLGNTLEG